MVFTKAEGKGNRTRPTRARFTMLIMLELARVPSTSYPLTPLAGTVDGSNFVQRRKHNVGKRMKKWRVHTWIWTFDLKLKDMLNQILLFKKPLNNIKHIGVSHERLLAKCSCLPGHIFTRAGGIWMSKAEGKFGNDKISHKSGCLGSCEKIYFRWERCSRETVRAMWTYWVSTITADSSLNFLNFKALLIFNIVFINYLTIPYNIFYYNHLLSSS